MPLVTFVCKDVVNCAACHRHELLHKIAPTRDGLMLCPDCAIRLNVCEDCGSVKVDGEVQQHYDQRCVVDWGP